MVGDPLLLLGIGYFMMALLYVLRFRETLGERVGSVSDWLGEQLLETLDHVPEAGMDWRVEAMAMERVGTTDRGQLGLQTILAAFTIVIAVSVIVIVVDRFDQSLGTPDSSALSQSQVDVLQGFADMTSLIGPLLLVSIGIVIIGLIRRVGGE